MKDIISRLKSKTTLSIIYALAACLLVIANISAFLVIKNQNSEASDEGFSISQFAAKHFDFQYGRQGKKGDESGGDKGGGDEGGGDEGGGTKIDVKWDENSFPPGGIDIRGTLVLNFNPAISVDSKVRFELPLKINPISTGEFLALDAEDPDTFVRGYPGEASEAIVTASQTATDSDGNPITPFTESDDLPALMYRSAIADLHREVNISGVVYSPVFAEIERNGNSTQYVNGAIIGGGGIFIKDKGGSTGGTIVNYDPNTLNRLATDGSNGQSFRVVHRE